MLVRVATYYNQFDAELAKIKLEEKQLFCFIKNEHLAQLQFGIAHFELMVKEEDKDLAQYYLENIPDNLDTSMQELNEE